MDANHVQEGYSNDYINNQTISCKSEKDNSINDQQENDPNVNDDDQEGLDHSSSSQVSTTSSSLLLPPPPIYEINQKVECRYGVVATSNDNNNNNNNENHDNSSENQWYDAIIRKMKLQPISTSTSTSSSSSSTAGDNNQNVPQPLEWSYLVHYQGWNSRYDQWCTGESIRLKPERNNNITTASGNNSDNETSLPTTANSITPQRIKSNKRSPSRSPRHKSMSTSSQSSEMNGNRKRSRNNHSTTTTVYDNSTLSVPIVCTYSDYCKLPITLQIIVIEEHERMTNYCKYQQQQEQNDDLHNQSLVYLHHLPAFIPIRKVLNSFIKKKIKEIHKQQLLLVTKTTTTNHLDDHHPATTTTSTSESNNNDLHTPTKKIVHSSTTLETNHQQQPETIHPETKTTVSNNVNKTIQSTSSSSSLPTITEDIIRQFGKSLQELFQHALYKCLLYPIEREQYMNIVLPMLQHQQDEGEVDNEISNTTSNDNVDTNASNDTTSKKIKKKLELIDIYGCEYLLRLYIRLPMLLQGTMLYTTTTTMNGRTDTAVLPSTTPLSSPYILGPLLSDLLIVLQKHRQTLFFTKS